MEVLHTCKSYFAQSVWQFLVCSDGSDSMLNVATEGRRGSRGSKSV